MENTTLKAENLKPIVLKAGVPLAVSLAGLIYAWIMAKKSSSKVSSFSKIEADPPEESLDNFSSMVDEEEHASSIDSNVLSGSLVIRENHSGYEQEITILRNQIEGLKMRELALTFQFEKYCEMKEQESLLMEMKNMLFQETSHVEFLDREISFIETEATRLESFLVQYMRIIEKVEYWKSENEMLRKKVQKLLRKSKAQSHLIKEQKLKIKEGEEEILRNNDGLQTRESVINKLEDEIKELQSVLEKIQDEKNELMKKLDTAEACSSKEQLHRKPLKYYLQVESGDVKKEDYNQLLNELEQVKKEHASEVQELIYLRRINDCLRQELMRHHIEVEFEGSGEIVKYDWEHELHCCFVEHNNVSCIGSASAHGDPAFPKRRKLLKRLKKWVEGSDRGRVKPEGKNSHEIKCFDGHFVSYGSEKPEGSATPRFCSSA